MDLLFFRRPVIYLKHIRIYIFQISLQKTSSYFQNRFTIPLYFDGGSLRPSETALSSIRSKICKSTHSSKPFQPLRSPSYWLRRSKRQRACCFCRFLCRQRRREKRNRLRYNRRRLRRYGKRPNPTGFGEKRL